MPVLSELSVQWLVCALWLLELGVPGVKMGTPLVPQGPCPSQLTLLLWVFSQREVSWSMFPWGSCVHIANWEAPGDKLFSAGNPNKTILQEDSSKLSSPTVSPGGQQGFPFPSQAPAPLPPQGTLPRSGRGRGAIPVQGAQSPAVGWWEMFAGGGGLAAILPLP